MRSGSYFYSVDGDCCFLKMKGDLRYSGVLGLENFLEQQFKKNKINNFVIDLTEAEWMDSTNLGILAQVARYLRQKQESKPILVSTNVELNQLLDNMGIRPFFKIIENPENIVQNYKKIMAPNASRQTLFKTVKKAHEQLIELNPENLQRFRELMKLLEQNSH